MWVEKVAFQNVRCFEQTDILFTLDEREGAKAEPYKWITLLGENGVGKSTILQSIALLLAGPEAAKELLPRPSGWVRDPQQPGRIGLTIHQEQDDVGVFGKEQRSSMFAYSYTITGDQPVTVIALSDGYRSVIAFAGDLIWRLIQAFPDLDDPTQASGVVLIDELDIHLHPRWQRQIAGWLREVFPRLQFFVATHSPLVAIGAGSDALTLTLELVHGEIQITRREYGDEYHGYQPFA